jgi:phosphoglycerol transferase MdoB-like AlkP superfamily enzyme
VFLATAVATSVTGFGFPFTGILPSHVLGAIALVVLGFGIVARYRFVLRGVWRWIYALTTVTSVYLLAFVAIAQTFQKVPALQAPNLSAVLFTAAQVSALAVFAALAVVAVRTFRPPLAGRALG